ncbi:YchJ family protein [Coralloluteibacterium stylophorae]|uniref:UPF0225 protein KB893_017990 n=1 Tax=Coralloluteibacterium stylophorae TaxID=1776034 RepID=A0A8J8AZR4_9GAMM|nr:YchJ family metal-binding protein [Coralloluteibacterium stylophorae]MBS7459024.1 SEC-C domain-containing protein [Coralloluteibacterium stylophorae]
MNTVALRSCPCGSGRRYAACCGELHAGARVADTAESLMRSRYSAYVVGDLDYLRASWHPATCPDSLEADVSPAWLALDIKRHVPQADAATRAKVAAALPALDADTPVSTVEFVARFRIGGGRVQRMTETSRFVREADRWLYVDGDVA